jgi:AraC-like DNA-binding protein
MKAKPIRVPEDLGRPPDYHRDLKLNGLSIVESCTHTQRRQGAMYLEDHMLLVILEGQMKITHGNSEYNVRKNEIVLLNKAIQIDYDKTGNPQKDNIFNSLMFFLKDEFLYDFIKLAKIGSVQTAEVAKVTVKPVNQRIRAFFDSVVPFFAEPENIDGPLVRLKMLELLYNLSNTDKNLLRQVLQLKQQVYADIPTVVMENYTSPATLSELAYLSGRSLSSFKRDFFSIYHVTPAQWIRQQRLTKAKELLNAGLPVTEVCYSVGFENLAHFSRLYKTHFGCSPSSHRPAPQPAA